MIYARILIFSFMCCSSWLAHATGEIGEPTYVLTPSAKVGNIGREGYIELPPKKMTDIFGSPVPETWDSESLGGYYFVSKDGEVFTVYHRAYDLSKSEIERLRKTFWTRAAITELSVGAKRPDNVESFKKWLLLRVKEAQ